MALLARLLQLLNFLESLMQFGDFLLTPVGLTALVGLGFYGPLVVLGCDASTAATLAGSVALGIACAITKPDF